MNLLASQQAERSQSKLMIPAVEIPGTAEPKNNAQKRTGQGTSPENGDLSQRRMKLKLLRLLESKNVSQRTTARNRF